MPSYITIVMFFIITVSALDDCNKSECTGAVIGKYRLFRYGCQNPITPHKFYQPTFQTRKIYHNFSLEKALEALAEWKQIYIQRSSKFANFQQQTTRERGSARVYNV